MVAICAWAWQSADSKRNPSFQRTDSFLMAMRLIHYSVLLTIFSFTSSLLQCSELNRLRYRNPGLQVDLGVGLWAWPVPCDADGDGDFDLIVSCPDKPSNGVYVFENATGETRHDKFPVFKPGKRISSTVHYVMPSYVDGKLRVMTPGREYLNFTKTGLSNSVSLQGISPTFYQPKWTQTRGPKIRHNQWRWSDYDGDGVHDIIVGIEDWSDYGWDDAWSTAGSWTNGPLHGFVHVFLARGSQAFAPPFLVEAGGKNIDTYGCPTPNFADFDRDGDLDLLCGEFLDGFTYFKNVGTRQKPLYQAGTRIRDKDGREVRMELQMIVPIAFDWDQDGDDDLIVGDEDGRVALVENSGDLDAENNPVFVKPRYFRQEADTLKCGALATPVGVDWDGDGDIDLVSGNTAGYIEIFENLSGVGVEVPRWAAPVRLEVNGQVFRIQAGPNGSIQGPAEAKWGYTTLSVADWDLDGLVDIVFNSIWGRVDWMKNVGAKHRPRFVSFQPVEVMWDGASPKPTWTWWNPKSNELVTQWRTTPVVEDFNQDGLPDLVMLDHEGFLVFFERFRVGGSERLGLRHPRRAFVGKDGKSIQLNPKRAGGSGRRKLCIVDWDGDGRKDLLLNSANADLWAQVGFTNGVWMFDRKGPLAERNIEGHDVSPASVDFDADGIPDFLGGAEDGGFYFMKNPRNVRRSKG